MKTPLLLRLALLSLLGISLVASGADLNQAIDSGVKRGEKAKQSQQKINAIDADIRSLERDYRSVLKEADGLKVYIKQLDKQLASQNQELSDIEESIRQVTLIERQVTPLMLKMIDSLELFVAADVPFQIEQRMQRVEKLKALMGRSDVTAAEKYRKVTDAYQKEMNYGRTIKSYRAPLEVNNETIEVDFLRVGRIALVYQSIDGENSGMWNNDSRSWQPLGAEYKSKLMMALRIAREQAAPDLIKVPVPAAKAY